MNRIVYLLFVFTGIFLCLQITAFSQLSFPWHSSFKYLKGSEAAGLSQEWMAPGFDDSEWSVGDAPFRYGDGQGGTLLNDMQYNYSTVYLRASFEVSQVSSLKLLQFTVDYDDGFVVWINNQEVFRRNAPEFLSYYGFAPDYRESGAPELILIDSSEVLLFEGANQIAVQGFNCNLESSDFYFGIEFSAMPALPDSAAVSFSHPAGFYDTPFDLSLTASDPELNIVYTLDGSDPTTSSTAILAADEVILNIDPGSSENRPTTPGYIVRASVAKEGYASSIPHSATYIFLESVKTHQHPGGGWPTDNINEQVIDLAMDPDVFNHSLYTDSIDDALLAIPSISVSTDLDNLFEETMGIYVNATGHGPEWERPCSVELINPDGSEGFQINAGLRIRGGWSRHPEFPKHSFRLFFRRQYGESKLSYPMFEDEGLTEYDKLDLRTSQNYAWANGSGEHNTMVRDIFCRDSQRAIDQPYTRSRYYHLYLNGLYWGLFQSQERSDAKYAAAYLGGNEEDYDVIKVNTEDFQYDVEATDGSMDAWAEIWNMCGGGFENNADYFMLEGKNQHGKPVKGSEIRVDIDNLIDYMINIFYTGNFDSPTSSFGDNKGPNNFYAVFNRDDKSKGFVFFVHDAEHTMMVSPVGPGAGIMENRVEPENMFVYNIYGFHPQWLHHKLSENEEYRVRFADKAYRHLKGNGIFTPGEGIKRFNDRAEEISMAIVAESARWGDTHSGIPYTKYNAWVPEITEVNTDFFPFRTTIVLNQLEDAGLFTFVQPPAIQKSGSAMKQGSYYVDDEITLTIKNNNTSGTIYYTLSGEDPRKTGGTVSATAIPIQSGETIKVSSSEIIRTRVHMGSSWSPIKTYEFLSAKDDYSTLKVSELHYHPKDVIHQNDTISGKSFEFIEFLNVGESALNLSGFNLETGVLYEFPDKTILPPKGFFVVVTKPKYFYEAYGMVAKANCEDFFSNSGESIFLSDSLGNEVLSFIYDDQSPWPETADGEGYSLTASTKYPTGNPNDPAYWMPSSTPGGSPFAFDSLYSLKVNPLSHAGDFLHVFPNPVTEVLHLEANVVGNKKIQLLVHDSFGRLVYKTFFREDVAINFKLLGVPAGLYILSCKSGNFSAREKIIYTP